jgi:hypothetical protein
VKSRFGVSLQSAKMYRSKLPAEQVRSSHFKVKISLSFLHESESYFGV